MADRVWSRGKFERYELTLTGTYLEAHHRGGERLMLILPTQEMRGYYSETIIHLRRASDNALLERFKAGNPTRGFRVFGREGN